MRATVRYIDESARLRRKLLQGSNRALRSAGAAVVARAQSSLRVAGRKSLGELTRRERQIYNIKRARARRRGRRVPPLPRRPSAPGQPPHISSASSPLRTGIQLAADQGGQRVVIGPIDSIPGDVPHELEYGSGRMQARPFMRPALAETIQSGAFARLFTDMT